MDFIKSIFEMVFHLDKHLDFIIKNFGSWTYVLLFGIIFAETGLVITPFLPGDSLLFVVGAFAAIGSFNIFWLLIILILASILGDNLNYAIGKFIGKKLLEKGDHRFFKKEYVDKTHKFFEKYGGKTIILAKFAPIVRTFSPFVAGLGKMSYLKFIAYDIFAALLWINIFVLGGYFFGNFPMVKEHFSVVILVIIFVSLLPISIEFWKHKMLKKKSNNLK